ncbi:Re/Si-specific NAD(P)(+) transhydrogenase subunit alpha [Legionella micdadei]|uniref:NAD(P) transhydrogenase subunit alpha part 1 n=1 Tax=Legionella micdadei TaxID=451 RepID=A0A098GH25_LEGMI|nr:Re/Si-specific NAD(P)(+) transhydrogenase subunit alpha [Legionella micdadei]ARG97249.1 NAD(P) transhydrogenase subunit alpha [Legionella micdadei]ARH00494.1 NAD(P) transhydrogenase subunit alpha [Legionella micdadei]KTD29142.1 pyridine nucleotide transhydrogenase, alpha subunit [Legionella micdadei]NSL17482.1 Re/Si-specific NAD(P)(+) transhydrogenase subunit alpha [Legionella micdadei]CEG61295.1 NAD(P) transhydrogenase subunit alpha part 1 [Legionella micdadei]
MIIAALNENSSNETRVAITPNAVKHYLKLGLEVICEKNAGHASGFSDSDYEAVGAKVADSRDALLQNAKILVCVNEPSPADLQGLAPHSLVIGHIDNDQSSELLTWASKEKMSIFSMNLIPRISRAQSMDSLSSQANLAGYRGVLEGVAHFNRAVPMMMTAAGMIHPAKILILGAGVAGLQAIATAKRLGAVVYAFDVRRAAKEQVESLGAEFIEVGDGQDAETSGGYAAETSEEYRRMQAELIDQYAKQSDIIVSTALIPGKRAPILLTKKTVEQMKAGSVIVDLATSRGGNCELSLRDKVVKEGEVTIIGYSNLAGLIPATASELYANNLVHLVTLLVGASTELAFNKEDEIVKQAILCHDGNYLPFQMAKETL